MSHLDTKFCQKIKFHHYKCLSVSEIKLIDQILMIIDRFIDDESDYEISQIKIRIFSQIEPKEPPVMVEVTVLGT